MDTTIERIVDPSDAGEAQGAMNHDTYLFVTITESVPLLYMYKSSSTATPPSIPQRRRLSNAGLLEPHSDIVQNFELKLQRPKYTARKEERGRVRKDTIT
jgi:hypothetical protein